MGNIPAHVARSTHPKSMSLFGEVGGVPGTKRGMKYTQHTIRHAHTHIVNAKHCMYCNGVEPCTSRAEKKLVKDLLYI